MDFQCDELSFLQDLLMQYETLEDEFSKIREIEIDEISLNDTDYFVIELGSQNFTFKEFNSNYLNTIEITNKLEEKVNNLENSLKKTIVEKSSVASFNEINITGDIDIKGALTVGNLTIGKLNGIPMNLLMDECHKTRNTKISGVKSFPGIIFSDDKFKIKTLNKVPLESYRFYDQYKNIDFTGVNLSKVTKLEIKNNLEVSRMAGIDFREIMKNAVFKNKNKIIKGTTVVSGVSKKPNLNNIFLKIEF